MSIVVGSKGKISQQLTREETILHSKKLLEFFCKHIHENSSVLLYMSHNIHIPAIVLSFQNSCHCFVPVDVNSKDIEVQELIGEAYIRYILSLASCQKIFDDFEPISDLDLGQDKIILWKLKQSVSSKTELSASILCIIPSSGTTGRKKLIKIESYCIQQNVDSISKVLRLDQNDVIYFGTPLTFDPSLVELLLALKTGATLLIVPDNIKLNPSCLFQTLFPKNSEYSKPTFLQMVPSLFTRWSEEQIQYIVNESQLKYLALGGERFPSDILKFQRSVRLFNFYGITEVSCWATIHEVTEENEVFLGDILEETVVKVCQDDGKELEEGSGELFIGSKTRFCYVNDERQQIEWRATGDLVIKTKQGLKYLGRKNNIIKRLGHRIALEEIEKKIYKKIKLANKCVWFETASKLLVFISIPTIHKEDKTRILDKLRVKLLHSLSNEEFPDFLDIISMFPVTLNGKIDKNSLIEIYKHSKIDTLNLNVTHNEIFQTLIAKYLGQSVSNSDNIKTYTFFELGGNSILYTLLLNDLREYLNFELPSEFLSLLLDESIGHCVEFLKKVQLTKSICKKKCDIQEILGNEKKRKYSEAADVIWKYNLQGCVDAPPLVFQYKGDMFIAVGSFSNFFAVLNANSGDVQYLKQFPDAIESKAAVSPCSTFLYVGCFDGVLYCINLEQSEIEWRYLTGSSIKCTPGFFMGNDALIFGSYDKYLHCVNAKNGICIWKTNVQVSIISTPLHYQSSNQVLTTTLTGSCISISEQTGIINWQIDLNNPIFGSPCKTIDCLIVADVRGNIHAIDVVTRKKQFEFNVAGEVYSSVIFIENHLIFSSHKGFLYKCKLKTDYSGCENVKKLFLGEPISTTPCTFNHLNKLLIAVFTIHGHLYLVRFDTLEIVSHSKCSGDIYSSPSVYGNKLYVGCRDDNLYCFQIDAMILNG